MRSCVAALAIAGAALIAAPVGGSHASDYSASVIGPPKVQVAGLTYRLTIRIRNLGGTVRPFCIDFTDDNNSWLIEMGASLSSWDSDTWCVGTLAAGARKTLVARVIPAKQGAHKMSITLGVAKIYRTVHDAIIVDDNALYWESQFVIVS